MWTTCTARSRNTYRRGQCWSAGRPGQDGAAAGPGYSSDPRISGDGDLARLREPTPVSTRPMPTCEQDVSHSQTSAPAPPLWPPRTQWKKWIATTSPLDGQYVASRTARLLCPGWCQFRPPTCIRGNLGTGATTTRLKDSSRDCGVWRSVPPADVSISGDGRWVAFASSFDHAGARLQRTSTAPSADIFARDMPGGRGRYLVGERFDVASAGANGESSERTDRQNPALVGDVKVAFASRRDQPVGRGRQPTRRARRASTCGRLRSMSSVLDEPELRAASTRTAGPTSPSMSDDGSLVQLRLPIAQNLGPDPDCCAAYLRNVDARDDQPGLGRRRVRGRGRRLGDGKLRGTWCRERRGDPGQRPGHLQRLRPRARRLAGADRAGLPAVQEAGAFLLPAANDYNYQDYARRITRRRALHRLRFRQPRPPGIERREADLPPGHGDRRDRTGRAGPAGPTGRSPNPAAKARRSAPTAGRVAFTSGAPL